jgi:hypothetical protein
MTTIVMDGEEGHRVLQGWRLIWRERGGGVKRER